MQVTGAPPKVDEYTPDELAKLEELRREVAVGMADIDAGNYVTLEPHEIEGFMDDRLQRILEKVED